MDATPTPQTSGGSGGWTIMLVCAGIAVIAACLLIPEADENQRLLWECEQLKIDLEHVQKQVATNEEFVKRVSSDPTLQERLIQRQLKYVRRDSSVLDLGKKDELGSQSPFPLVAVPASPTLAPPQPRGGRFITLCRDTRSRIYLIGGALVLVAMGLVLGAAGPKD